MQILTNAHLFIPLKKIWKFFINKIWRSWNYFFLFTKFKEILKMRDYFIYNSLSKNYRPRFLDFTNFYSSRVIIYYLYVLFIIYWLPIDYFIVSLFYYLLINFRVNIEKRGFLTDFIALWICCRESCSE